MLVLRAAAAAACCSILLAPAAARAGPACWRPRERAAAQVQALQTMLMVGALHCRSRDTSAADAYNRFVESHRGNLKRHARMLRRHFEREDRAAAVAAYDRYATSVANQYSRNFDRGELCWTVASLASEAADADREGLLLLAQSYTRPRTEPPCG